MGLPLLILPRVNLRALNVSVLLGTVANVGNGDSKSATFNLPPGAQGLGYALNLGSPNGLPNSITMTGNNSQLPYVQEIVGTGGTSAVPPAWADEVFPEDTQVTVVVQTVSGGPPTLTYVHAYFYNPRTRISGSTFNSPPIAVTMAQALPAGWELERPYDWTVPTNTAFTNGPAAITAPAQSGKTIVLGAYSADVGSFGPVYNTDVDFLDSSSARIWRDGCNVVANGSDRARQGGLRIQCSGAGLSLTFKLVANVPANVFANLSMAGWYV